jgi:hypothetical protein
MPFSIFDPICIRSVTLYALLIFFELRHSETYQDADSLPSGPSKHPGALSAIINLVPGTHHVRFIVDNDMRLSKFMPTAVDYTNFLVNYIEVATPQPLEPKDDSKVLKQPSSMAVPVQAPVIQVAAPLDVHTLQVLPNAPEPAPAQSVPRPDIAPKAIAGDPRPDKASTETLSSQVDKPKMAPIAIGPLKKYHTQIPQFLLDIEAEDDQSLYHRASAVIHTLPEPPSLPMFLGKSVLNGATPMKDDASVLVMPNHTVLNHLATSSIKNKVLATSATTRYKKKVSHIQDLTLHSLTQPVPDDNNVQTHDAGQGLRVTI